MAYALQSMLRIRAMREDRAATELTAARREVTRAQERLSQRKRDLEEYEATKEARRDRIFEAVVGRAVSMEDLDLAREGSYGPVYNCEGTLIDFCKDSCIKEVMLFFNPEEVNNGHMTIEEFDRFLPTVFS